MLAGTPASSLPRSRRVPAQRVVEMAPTVRRDGLDGGLLAYDGQLIDDARLVTAVARTAAQHGARILTYVAASEATGTSVHLTDQRTGQSFDVSAGAVINAAGVWAGNQVARWFGVAVLGLNAIDQMFFIPAYPFWSLMIIAVDVVALYGLCAYGSRANLEAA